ncbi:MAG: carbon-nitrogen hydrolase family protein [Dehalococcoidia bacterium]|nr:carbon-nitrogen hydrolase family protein [Dehalococcoidia bacterium]
MQPFRVALCQVRAYDLEDAETNLENLLRALDEAGAAGAQLVALPECAYPAYYVRDADPYSRPGVRPYAEVLGMFAERARRYGYWLAAGMAVPHAGGTLTNSGVVISPEGERVGRYDKSFLWHFDNTWFERGRAFPVFDAGFCRFGVLICADGRQPEVARMLAVNGAEVIVDLTAWVSWGRTPGELTTTQCEYLMPVRAFENGAWVVAADKWGPEDGSIIYAGRSSVFDPAGVSRVCGPSDRDAVIVYDLEPMAGTPVPRRPALYGALTRPTETLGALALETQPLVPAEAGWRVGVVPGEGAFDASELARRFAALRAQDVDLVVAAGLPGGAGWEDGLAVLERAAREHGGGIVAGIAANGAGPRQFAALVTADGVTLHQATHGEGLALGETNAILVPTPVGNVGVLAGAEGFVPEVPRALALDGADVLAWTAFEPHPMLERVARARADENRVYCAVAWPGGGLVTNPDGAMLTAVPAGTGVAMAASGSCMFSRWKDRAPRTHVIRDRVPEAYGPLTR